jgi:hypothetical protein
MHALAVAALLAQAAPAGAAGDRLSFDGLGPARIGMSRQALEAALGGPLSRDDATEDAASCEIVYPLRRGDSISYMLLDGRLARIDIDNDRTLSVSGIGLDALEAAVLAAYPGRVTVTPHAYTGPEGKYLTLLSRDGSRGMRFETSDARVTRFYAGTEHAIQLIEGCQ